MNQNYYVKRYSLAEVTLLGIFALGLLLSNFLVISRNTIRLSGPISLDFAGITAALPRGPGWQVQEQWQYYTDNDYVLVASLNVGGKVDALVRWRYLLAPEKTSLQYQMENSILKAGAKIENRGHIGEKVRLEWAQVETADGFTSVFVGMAVLADERAVEIEVVAAMEPEFSRKIFFAVAPTLVYEPSRLLQKGEAFVEFFRNSGADTLLGRESLNPQAAYIISDEKGNLAGFSIDSLSVSHEPGNEALVKGESFTYTTGVMGRTSNYLFECEGVDRFIWQSKHQSPAKRRSSSFEIELSQGLMQVSNMISSEDKKFWPGRGTIAGFLLDCAAAEFLDFDAAEAVVDMVFSDGSIVPALFRKLDKSQIPSGDGAAEFALEIEYLHSANAAVRIYFDKDKQIISKMEQNQQKLYWQRTTKDNLMKKFTGWEKYFPGLGV